MRNKRMIALLLIICVVLTCLPVPVSAAGVVESGKAGKNVTWTMYDDGTLVFSGIGPTDDNDDSTIKNWCRHAREVKHIVFEEGIAYIGEWFFKSSYKFKRLESVTIPTTVTAIGKYAFNGLGPYMKRVYISDLAKFCSIDFKGSSASPLSNVDLYLNGEKVETLVIPDTVKAIPEQTFLLCTSIKTVVIPPNVKTIGSLAFGSCNSLTKVVFQGDAPTVDGKLFTNITPYVYYPQNNKTWTKEVIDAYNDNATWIAYNPAAEDVLSDAYPGGEPQSCIEWYFDEETSTLIFSGRGDMEDYRSTSFIAWKQWNSETRRIVFEEGVTRIGDRSLWEFEHVTNIMMPSTLKSIGSSAFWRCGIQAEQPLKIYFKGDAPVFEAQSFLDVRADAYYPADNQTWTPEIMKNYGGIINWIAHHHAYSSTVTPPTCTRPGCTTYLCTECGYTRTEEIAPLDHQWNDESLLIKTCTVCGAIGGGYRIDLDARVLGSAATVCIDGKEYPVAKDDTGCYVLLTQTDATNITAYTYNDPNAGDLHLQYPTGMKVWTLKFADGAYQATYIKEFDNLLQYSGSSIRITGKKGIRMITSIDKSTKKALTGKGLAGYTLEEYGTALAWASDLENDNPLVLGKAYTKSNFAYKKGKADPVFKDTGKLIQYTNVLVGFNDNQCVPDIAMRPYIILKDGQGNLLTIYGGTVYRSIGYIAYQNRTAFKAGTSSYKYVWGIIHYVYGTKYDADYQK